MEFQYRRPVVTYALIQCDTIRLYPDVPWRQADILRDGQEQRIINSGYPFGCHLRPPGQPWMLEQWDVEVAP